MVFSSQNMIEFAWLHYEKLKMTLLYNFFPVNIWAEAPLISPTKTILISLKSCYWVLILFPETVLWRKDFSTQHFSPGSIDFSHFQNLILKLTSSFVYSWTLIRKKMQKDFLPVSALGPLVMCYNFYCVLFTLIISCCRQPIFWNIRGFFFFYLFIKIKKTIVLL